MAEARAELVVPDQFDPSAPRPQFVFADMRLLAESSSCDCDCDCDAGDIDNY